MRLSKLLATITLVVCFTATSAFAAPEFSSQENTDNKPNICDGEKKDLKCKKHKWDKAKLEEFQKDPVKALENRKKEIQTMLKDGKITKEKADEITQRLNLKIKKINEFNKLSLTEKKDKLIGDLKNRLEQRIKDGKITQDKANEIIKKHTEKIESWDGNGFPGFFEKGFRKNK